jgi:hypothetical protein
MPGLMVAVHLGHHFLAALVAVSHLLTHVTHVLHFLMLGMGVGRHGGRSHCRLGGRNGRCNQDKHF